VIVGYYIRGSGERWQLIRQNERYEDEVVANGLSFQEAVALYWRKMAELAAPAEADAAPVRQPRKRSPQLSLKL